MAGSMSWGRVEYGTWSVRLGDYGRTGLAYESGPSFGFCREKLGFTASLGGFRRSFAGADESGLQLVPAWCEGYRCLLEDKSAKARSSA